MYTLFAAKGTVAVAPHIALEEIGTPYGLTWVDFANNEQTTSDYHALNPKGRVPVLAFDGTTLTETPAILEYLAEASGQLMPADPIKRAEVRELMAYLCATVHVNHAHGKRAGRWADDADAQASMIAKVTENMTQNANHLNDILSGGGWYAGTYSIADIYIFTVCRWLADDGVTIADFPDLAHHFAQMLARPAVQTVQAAHG